MLATRNDIEKYIPQRPPMVMVHDLVVANEVQAVTRLEVMKDNIFVVDNYLQEAGLIENIAQTAAAQVGYLSHQQNQAVPLGFIASIKALSIHALPEINSVITTTVRITNKVLDVTIIEGEVKQDDRVVCSCEMRIFIKP